MVLDAVKSLIYIYWVVFEVNVVPSLVLLKHI